MNKLNKAIFITIIILLSESLAYAGTGGLGRGLALIGLIIWLTIIIPIILLIIWLLTRIWPKKHSTTSWILISAFDSFFIIYVVFAISGWLQYGRAISLVFFARLWSAPNSHELYWFYPERIFLLLLSFTLTVYAFNYVIYKQSRLFRTTLHALFSIIMMLTILSLNEPKFPGSVVKWLINPELLFLVAGDPTFDADNRLKYGRWSDYYRFDQDVKEFYHFEEELLGRNRYYRQDFEYHQYADEITGKSVSQTEASSIVSNYLLLQDIGDYKFVNQKRQPYTDKLISVPGYTVKENSGVLIGFHFAMDHKDLTYFAKYRSRYPRAYARGTF